MSGRGPGCPAPRTAGSTVRRISVLAWVVVAVVVLAFGADAEVAESSAEATVGVVCDQPHASCAAARCRRDFNNPRWLVCQCEESEGLAWGRKSCAERAPDGAKLTAALSYGGADEPRRMACPEGGHWGDCIDATCRRVGDEVRCLCELRSGSAFTTRGGGCDEAACSGGEFWSGEALGETAPWQALEASHRQQDRTFGAGGECAGE